MVCRGGPATIDLILEKDGESRGGDQGNLNMSQQKVRISAVAGKHMRIGGAKAKKPQSKGGGLKER